MPTGTLLIRATGEIDIESGPVLRAAVLAVAAHAPGVVLDMTGVVVVSAAGFRAVADAAARLADNGQRLLLARCRSQVLAALRHTGATGVVEMLDTVDAAVAALTDPTGPGGSDLARVRALARALPGSLQTRPVIETAVALLRRRYDLPDTHAAFALLRNSSQRHNLKLRTLAAALLTTSPPDRDSPVWFAGRRRRPAPMVTFTAPRQEWRDSRSAFLSDVLDSALLRMATDRGNLQLVDPILGGLRLELSRGLPREFVGLFAHVQDTDVACAVALRSHARAVVADVAASPAYADPELRTVMRAADTRAVQSTPLLSPDGRCQGMVSTLHTIAGRIPLAGEAADLDLIGDEAGAWLLWHRRAIVLDALEHLHQSARRAH